LELFDGVMQGYSIFWNDDDGLIIITSDHGNRKTCRFASIPKMMFLLLSLAKSVNGSPEIHLVDGTLRRIFLSYCCQIQRQVNWQTHVGRRQACSMIGNVCSTPLLYRLILFWTTKPRCLTNLSADITSIASNGRWLLAQLEGLPHPQQDQPNALLNYSTELRTPATSILGFSQMMLEHPSIYSSQELSPAQYEHVKTIFQNVQDLHSAINDMFHYHLIYTKANCGGGGICRP
jgi:signal transduction histidine kinase